MTMTHTVAPVAGAIEEIHAFSQKELHIFASFHVAVTPGGR